MVYYGFVLETAAGRIALRVGYEFGGLRAVEVARVRITEAGRRAVAR
jgi:hypothetical protein